MFHSRTHDIDNLWEDIADISLPPDGAVKHCGRCNIPGQPVFYCSENRPTSYMELVEYWAKEKKEPLLYVTIGG